MQVRSSRNCEVAPPLHSCCTDCARSASILQPESRICPLEMKSSPLKSEACCKCCSTAWLWPPSSQTYSSKMPHLSKRDSMLAVRHVCPDHLTSALSRHAISQPVSQHVRSYRTLCAGAAAPTPIAGAHWGRSCRIPAALLPLHPAWRQAAHVRLQVPSDDRPGKHNRQRDCQLHCRSCGSSISATTAATRGHICSPAKDILTQCCPISVAMGPTRGQALCPSATILPCHSAANSACSKCTAGMACALVGFCICTQHLRICAPCASAAGLP
jgi:hypothetical protein